MSNITSNFYFFKIIEGDYMDCPIHNYEMLYVYGNTYNKAEWTIWYCEGNRNALQGHFIMTLETNKPVIYYKLNDLKILEEENKAIISMEVIK